ncbi:LOW QUALITY PROTEIN: doublecortin domain-containing protein 1 [Phalacrocorax carbo]|uniref:LOW QUALITY PROTEIN: doublecortin domain-containing protein 1 n=1 Tax=Phalacrocorax carbo TaxID=9209 RepID=UPI003119DAC5
MNFLLRNLPVGTSFSSSQVSRKACLPNVAEVQPGRGHAACRAVPPPLRRQAGRPAPPLSTRAPFSRGHPHGPLKTREKARVARGRASPPQPDAGAQPRAAAPRRPGLRCGGGPAGLLEEGQGGGWGLPAAAAATPPQHGGRARAGTLPHCGHYRPPPPAEAPTATASTHLPRTAGQPTEAPVLSITHPAGNSPAEWRSAILAWQRTAVHVTYGASILVSAREVVALAPVGSGAAAEARRRFYGDQRRSRAVRLPPGKCVPPYAKIAVKNIEGKQSPRQLLFAHYICLQSAMESRRSRLQDCSTHQTKSVQSCDGASDIDSQKSSSTDNFCLISPSKRNRAENVPIGQLSCWRSALKS